MSKRRNRVHQRKLEKLYNRSVVNNRKLGYSELPLQGEWLLDRQSRRVKDFIRTIMLTRSRSPKVWLPLNKPK